MERIRIFRLTKVGDGRAKNSGQGMDDLDDGAKPVEQLAISISKLFEFFGLVFDQLKDVVGRTAGSKVEVVGKGVCSQVCPDLLSVVCESCIKDRLK